jgi:hypothetical protein
MYIKTYKIIKVFISTLIFSVIYYYIGKEHIFYNDDNTLLNNFYFSGVTQILLGDSTMRPITPLSKMIVLCQAFLTLIFLN